MGSSSAGALVPSVSKTEEMGASVAPPAVSSSETTDVAGTPAAPEADKVPDGVRDPAPAASEEEAERDKDLRCPICMGVIKDAFLTACGHSFCYMCIVTHLNNKSDCPCCGIYLTKNQLYPNFLLNKLLKKHSACQIAKTASPVEHLRLALQQVMLWTASNFHEYLSMLLMIRLYFRIVGCVIAGGNMKFSCRQGCEMSVKELDGLLGLLTEKRRKMEQQEAEMNMQILLDFLQCLKKKKLEELNEVQTDLQYVKEDINAVEKHRTELYCARERFSVKLRSLDDPIATKLWSPSANQHNSILVSNARSSLVGTCSGNLQAKSNDVKVQLSHQEYQRKDAFSGSETSPLIQSGRIIARKRRIQAQFNELQECYLQKRRLRANQIHGQEEKKVNVKVREGYHAGLDDFQSVLTTFTRYSIEFDRDDEFFATAGVSKRIKVFEFSTVVNEPSDVNCPVVELATRSKLSCLSWNKYSKNIIASSDYEGNVTVWDVNTRQVKVWCTKQEASVINIDMKANICCVKYNPGSSFHVAIGSADHHIHYFDLRNTSTPLRVFKGHWKAVSYVKFLSTNELASASTDSTLRLWDVKDTCPVRTFRGHTNEKNFVGLTVNNEYIACGSETNEVFVYHKAISKPAAWHKFGSSELDDAEDDVGSYFISAVCWKSDSPTMLTANSQGTIKVLVLAA
ncbi:hypothetical protein ZIOFF_013703 [Zingiber officinale]|uniref:RING-type domain-containing protein n=1 Tax=Zingiber officinale TaxID=94328 RepID=A0A8J5LUD3_ZINOF|nr:hypothetical protein ZIOFF_013703 [Zingiber officinale]